MSAVEYLRPSKCTQSLASHQGIYALWWLVSSYFEVLFLAFILNLRCIKCTACFCHVSFSVSKTIRSHDHGS